MRPTRLTRRPLDDGGHARADERGGVLPSKAWKAFNQNADDVKRLLEIHSTLGGDAPGRRYRLEVLNKSAIVLITAIWEAYCEDLAAEALNHLVNNVARGTDLPEDLKRAIATEFKSKDAHELAAWELADDGWKVRVKARLNALTEARNRRLNTPRAREIDELFSSAIGLQNVSAAWKWHRMTSARAAQKLDTYVTLRGAIAHRGSSGGSVKKVQVADYYQHVREIASRTGGRVNGFVKKIAGKGLW